VRVGAIPEGILETLLLRAGRLPAPLADTVGAMALARIVMAANRLGVFEALGDAACTAEETAGRIGCDPQATAFLMEALAASGYLRSTDGGYQNSPMARRWLGRSSSTSLNAYLRLQYEHWRFWESLEETIRTGKPVDLHRRLGRDADRWRTYLLGLRDLVGWVGREFVWRARLPKPLDRMLDLGGGHGGYAALLCRRFPRLAAVVLDLPEACRIGAELIARDGLEHRIRFVEGDLTRDPFGEGYDLALYINMAHHFTESENRGTFRKLYDSVRPGGKVLIADVVRRRRRSGRQAQVAAFGSLLFYITSGGGVYTEKQLTGWLSEAGFSGVKMQSLVTVPGAALITAERR
jgi:SAM-dependent methyltransferase